MFGWLKHLFKKRTPVSYGRWEIMFRNQGDKNETSLGFVDGEDWEALEEAQVRYVNHIWRTTNLTNGQAVMGQYYIKPVEVR